MSSKKKKAASKAAQINKSGGKQNTAISVREDKAPEKGAVTETPAEKKDVSQIKDESVIPARSVKKEEPSKTEKQKKEKKRLTFQTIFDNDKVMLALSFVIAFFIWAVMSVNNGETGNYPVTEIPVTMDLSEDAKESDLSVITINGVAADDFTATVRVKGNSVTVGSLKSSDINVYGTNLGNIVASGTYNVTLLARQLGVKNNYDIISVTPSEVKIVVDKLVTTELPIESQITATSPVDYYIGAPTLSQQTVVVTGPEQSVSKAVKAVVSETIEEELQETTTRSSLKVVLLDSEGNEIEDETISITPLEVDATIPVLVKKTVPLTLDFINAPPEFDMSRLVNLEPSEIEIAAPADTIASVESISAGTIDLSTISLHNAPMSCSIVMPSGVKNLSGVETTTVTFNFSDHNTRSFALTRFNYLNVPEGLVAAYADYGTQYIRVIGPKEEIAELTSDDLVASVDLTDSKIGTSVMHVSIEIEGNSSCWIYGTYSVSVTVKDENDVSSSAVSSSSVSSQ